MKKVIAVIMTLMLMVGLSVGLCGCDGEYTIKYYVDGELVKTVKTVEGVSSYVYEVEGTGAFVGWYSDKKYENKLFNNGNPYTFSSNTNVYGFTLHMPSIEDFNKG